MAGNSLSGVADSRFSDGTDRSLGSGRTGKTIDSVPSVGVEVVIETGELRSVVDSVDSAVGDRGGSIGEDVCWAFRLWLTGDAGSGSKG